MDPMSEEVLTKTHFNPEYDFSVRICDSLRIDDLDESAIGKYRSLWAGNRRSTRILGLSNEQLLRNCGAITSDGITYAALILFGREEAVEKYLPHREIIFEYRSTNAPVPASQREEFRAGFFSWFDHIWQLIDSRNDRQYYRDKFAMLGIPTFNEESVQEAVLNAVAHRSYEADGNIFIRQYSDRLMIESPGGFPDGITRGNILDRQSSRNALISDIFAVCGLVKRAGQGMNLMYEISIKEGKGLPDFTGTDEYGVSITLNGVVLDANLIIFLDRIGNTATNLFTTGEYLVLNDICHERRVFPKLQKSLHRLVRWKLVELTADGKYILVRKYSEALGMN